MTQTRLKEITDQNTKLHRGHKSMMSQLDKYRQSSETLKHKCEGLEAQLLSLRKVCVCVCVNALHAVFTCMCMCVCL